MSHAKSYASDIHEVEIVGYNYKTVAADALIKTGACVLHTITVSQADAAPTAGTITIYDNTEESGTDILFQWNLTTAVFIPFTVTLDAQCATGIYAGFATTADVNVAITWR